MVTIQGRILLKPDKDNHSDDDLFDGSGDEIENPEAFMRKFVTQN